MTASTDRSEPLLEGIMRVGPRFVERSRRQVEFAAAVVHGLRRLGGPRTVGAAASADATPTDAAPTGAAARPRRDPTVLDRVPSSPARVDPTPAAAPDPPLPPVAPTEAELPIDGFDSLAASQVVPRLVTLSPQELRAVQRYEQAGRHRQTILNRVEQLLADR